MGPGQLPTAGPGRCLLVDTGHSHRVQVTFQVPLCCMASKQPLKVQNTISKEKSLTIRKPLKKRNSPSMAPPAPHLVRGSHKLYPAIIQGNDKVPLEQLDVHLATPEQHQRVHGHHAAVPDEHTARLDLLVVHQCAASHNSILLPHKNTALGLRILTKGDLKAKLAAMVSAGSRQRKMVPNSMSLPILTSTGSEAKWYPKGVSFSSGVNAPRSRSRTFDACKDSVLGGSISRDKTEVNHIDHVINGDRCLCNVGRDDNFGNSHRRPEEHRLLLFTGQVRDYLPFFCSFVNFINNNMSDSLQSQISFQPSQQHASSAVQKPEKHCNSKYSNDAPILPLQDLSTALQRSQSKPYLHQNRENRAT
ncbi:hypothetical protein IHE44_0008866, partial [Lamprotornis superbus]